MLKLVSILIQKNQRFSSEESAVLWVIQYSVDVEIQSSKVRVSKDDLPQFYQETIYHYAYQELIIKIPLMDDWNM